MSWKRRAVIVVCVLVLLVGLLVSLVVGWIVFHAGSNVKVARDVRIESDLRVFEIQLSVYRGICGSIPTTEQGLAALVTRPSKPPVPRNWVKLVDELPPDPWGHPYGYRFPSKTNADAFDLFSLGPDGVESADDIVHTVETKSKE